MYSSNFGVIEVASARTTSAPGWAYVPDTGVNPAVAALQPANRKRARNQGGALTGADLSARQEAKFRKELETLDRDINRDITVPARSGGGRAVSKSTPGVRKILQSQKTFANHLDDYSALLAQAENGPAPHPNQHMPKPPHPNQHTRRPPQPNQYTKRNAAVGAGATAETSSRSKSRRSLKAEVSVPESETRASSNNEDVDMNDGPIEEVPVPAVLAPSEQSHPPVHTGDSDPLLVSVIPDLPRDEEMRKLHAHPPLSYAQARAAWGPGDSKYPARKFCDVCGYWGRVKCIKCGTRVCALDCLELHREGCLQRYGL